MEVENLQINYSYQIAFFCMFGRVPIILKSDKLLPCLNVFRWFKVEFIGLTLLASSSLPSIVFINITVTITKLDLTLPSVLRSSHISSLRNLTIILLDRFCSCSHLVYEVTETEGGGVTYPLLMIISLCWYNLWHLIRNPFSDLGIHICGAIFTFLTSVSSE